MSPSGQIPASKDIVPGIVLWLPRKEQVQRMLGQRDRSSGELVQQISPGAQHLDDGDGLYDHPILVVSRSAATPDRVNFVLLTTFKGKSLDLTFRSPSARKHWKSYLAVAGQNAKTTHPLFQVGHDAYDSLTFRHGATMQKAGYVKISCVYTIDRKAVERCTSTAKLELDGESMQRLMAGVKRMARYSPTEQSEQDHARIASSKHEHIRAQLPLLMTTPSPTSVKRSTKAPTTAAPVANYSTAVDDNEERQPLLPTACVKPALRNNEAKHGVVDSVCAWLDRTWIRVVRHVCLCGRTVTLED